MYSNHVLRNQVVDFWTLPCYFTHRSAAIWSWSAKLIKVNLSTSSVATQTKIIKHPNKHFLPPQSYYNDKPNRKQPHLWRPCRTILPLLKTSQFSTKSWSPTTRLLLSFVSDLPFLPKCCISFLWLVKCCKIISPYNTKKTAVDTPFLEEDEEEEMQQKEIKHHSEIAIQLGEACCGWIHMCSREHMFLRLYYQNAMVDAAHWLL